MPPGIRLNRIEGGRGEIRIPSLGIVVSRLNRPVLLRRREVATPELGQFDLHAAVSYFNQVLWDDPDFVKETVIWMGKRPLKILWLSGTSLIKVDGSLRIEGVEWQE